MFISKRRGTRSGVFLYRKNANAFRGAGLERRTIDRTGSDEPEDPTHEETVSGSRPVWPTDDSRTSAAPVSVRLLRQTVVRASRPDLDEEILLGQSRQIAETAATEFGHLFGLHVLQPVETGHRP